MAQMVKNLSVMQETWVWSLGWKDPLEKGKATHSSILAWRIPWAEEPGGLQSMVTVVGHVIKQIGFQNVPVYFLSCMLWRIESFHSPTSLLVVDIVRYLTIWWIWQSISFPKLVFASENIFLTYYILICFCYHIFLCTYSGKESTCQCRKLRFDPWVGKIPWRRKWLPIAVFLPGKSHGQGSLAGCNPWNCNELNTTERLNKTKQKLAAGSFLYHIVKIFFVLHF